MSKFREAVDRVPLTLVQDVDMTAEIAPTFDLLNRVSLETVKPIYGLLLDRLTLKYPVLMRFVLWKFRRTLKRAEQKHFSGRRDGAHFMKYKSYRLLLYQRGDR